MNYRPIAKNYSFLPAAATLASQGVDAVYEANEKDKESKDREKERQDRELERTRKAEEIAAIKVDLSTAEQLREQKIVEAATEAREAFGLPDDDKGREAALNIAASAFYPITGNERKDPSAAARRIVEFDETGWRKILDRGKIERYRRETSGAAQSVVGGKAGQQQPAGSVGIQDAATVRRSPAPTNAADYVAQANQDALSAPRTVTEVPGTLTAQESFDKARQIGVENVPEVQADIGRAGERELMDGAYPAGTTYETVAGEALRKPVMTDKMGAYAGLHPKSEPVTEKSQLELKKLKAEIDKINAEAGRVRTEVKSGGKDALSIKDLKDLNARMSGTIQQYGAQKLNLKKDDAMLPEIEEDIKILKNNIRENDALIRTMMKDQKLEGTPAEVPPGTPSEDAVSIANSIRQGVERLVPKGIRGKPKYQVVENLGRMTFVDDKGNARDDLYDNAAALQIVQYVKRSTGKDIPVNAIAQELKKSTIEDIIEYIKQQRAVE